MYQEDEEEEELDEIEVGCLVHDMAIQEEE
jgi:hypothetical protein